MYNGLISQQQYDALTESDRYNYNQIFQWYRRGAKVWEDDYQGMVQYPIFKDYIRKCQHQKIRLMYRLKKGIQAATPQPLPIIVQEVIVTKEVEVVKYIKTKYDVSNILREFEELGRQLRQSTNNPMQLSGIQLTLSAVEKLLSKHKYKIKA